MRTIQFILILTFSLFLASGPTGAQTVVFGDPTNPNMATGINNLEVGGIHYDVVFQLYMFANEIYGSFPGTFDIFDTAIEAENAVVAVNLALNNAGALSLGNLDQPGVEAVIYNIGYESFLLLQVESIHVWRGGIEGTDWINLFENQWAYNLDEKTYADFDITTSVDDDGVTDIPNVYNLFPNYPNPFNPSTTIQYSLPQESEVTVRILDVNGQIVKTLVNEVQGPGEQRVNWNGTANDGQKVSSGVYFYRLITEEFSQTRIMMLLK